MELMEACDEVVSSVFYRAVRTNSNLQPLLKRVNGNLELHSYCQHPAWRFPLATLEGHSIEFEIICFFTGDLQ